MKQYDDFDDVLSEALSEFREAEPRAGLAGRLKAGVGAAEHAPRFAWWKWAAVAAAAVLMIAFWIARPKAPVPVAHKEEAPAHTAPVQKVEKKQEVAVVPKVERRSVAKVEAVKNVAPPKTQGPVLTPVVTPPTPMNSQERALMALAQRAPAAVGYPTMQEKHEVLPEIPAIKITPLSGAQESGGEQ